MKLLLASQGFLTKEIANEVQRVVGKKLLERRKSDNFVIWK